MLKTSDISWDMETKRSLHLKHLNSLANRLEGACEDVRVKINPNILLQDLATRSLKNSLHDQQDVLYSSSEEYPSTGNVYTSIETWPGMN